MTGAPVHLRGPLGRALQRLARLLQRLTPVIAVLLLTAALLRWLCRDETVWSAPFFYALPLPLQAGGWLMLTLVWWRRFPPARLLYSLPALAAGAWWYAAAWHPRPTAAAPTAGPELKVLFWNIGHTKTLPERLPELIRTHQPDITALAESEELTTAAQAELATVLTGHQLLRMGSGMIILIRGTGQHLSSSYLKQKTFFHALEAAPSSPGIAPLRFVLCDLGPWPPLPRTWLLDTLLAKAGTAPRTIIAGDFNTPLDSAGFDAWRAAFHHGLFDCPGYHRPIETWGYGLPLLAIDHQWCSRDLVPVRAEKGNAGFMDHQWLLVTYRQK